MVLGKANYLMIYFIENHVLSTIMFIVFIYLAKQKLPNIWDSLFLIDA